MTRDKWLRNLLAAACCLLLASVLLSCDGQEVPADRSHLVITLFDVSASTEVPATRQLYYRDFQLVVDKLQGGDILFGDVITADSLATASFPLQIELPEYERMQENQLTHARQRDALLKALRADARRLIDMKTGKPNTDLLSALKAVEDVFTHPEYQNKTKVLVIFSDMIQQTAEYDFTAERLTDARIREIIEQERRAGRLPSLKGVNIWVVRATYNTTSTTLSNDRIDQIERFWIAYLTACGAVIDKSHYAPRLLAFSLPSG